MGAEARLEDYPWPQPCNQGSFRFGKVHCKSGLRHVTWTPLPGRWQCNRAAPDRMGRIPSGALSAEPHTSRMSCHGRLTSAVSYSDFCVSGISGIELATFSEMNTWHLPIHDGDLRRSRMNHEGRVRLTWHVFFTEVISTEKSCYAGTCLEEVYFETQ